MRRFGPCAAIGVRARVTGRPRADRGQALIEFSLFVTIMLLLLVGVTDVAGLLDTHESLVYAARQGARTGAVIGPQKGADCAIVGAVHSSLLNQPQLTLNQIIIYKALSDGSPDASHEDVFPGNADCVNGLLTVPASPNNWPPVQADGTPNRNATPYFEDSIGVQLLYTYQWQFGILGNGSFSASDAAVFPLDPDALPTPVPTNTVAGA